MSTLGNPLDDANSGPLEAIFKRKVGEAEESVNRLREPQLCA
jgi:hypothetical protein